MALPLRPGSIEFQLEDAITKGDTTGVKSLLTLLDAATRDALLSAPLDQAGSTALHLASDRDEVYVVHILLDALARVDKEDWQGQTPLHRACGRACVSVEVVRVLLTKGNANPQAQDQEGHAPSDLIIDQTNKETIRDMLGEHTWPVLTEGMVLEGRGRRSFRICEGKPRGGGFSGRVYAASEVPGTSEQRFALKVYRRHIDMQMMQREVLFLRRASDAKSGHIVQYVDDFVHPHVGPFVVMSPLCREALLDRVGRAGKARAAIQTIRSLTPQRGVLRMLGFGRRVQEHSGEDYGFYDAVKYVAQMAEGLASLHSRRVFYGDLALRNVLLGYDDRVLLADFGVSLDDHPSGIKVSGMYKFGSMSSPPEADDPAALLTVRSDCWSLGVCALLVLTKSEEGALEQALGKSLKEVSTQSLQDRIALLQGPIGSAFDQTVDKWVIEITARLLSSDQAERPDASNVAGDLRELGTEDMYCCISWSMYGYMFLNLIFLLLAGVLLTFSEEDPGAGYDVIGATLVLMSLGGVWAFLTYGDYGTRRLPRFVCLQLKRRRILDVPNLCPTPGDRQIVLNLTCGALLLGIGAVKLMQWQYDTINRTFLGFLVLGCLLWLNAVRLWWKKRREAKQRTSPIQGVDATQVLMV